MGKVLPCSLPAVGLAQVLAVALGLGTALVDALFCSLGHRRSLSVTTEGPRGDGGCDSPAALPRVPHVTQGCLQGWHIPGLVVAPAQGQARLL